MASGHNLPDLIRTGRPAEFTVIDIRAARRIQPEGESQWVFTGPGNTLELDGWLGMSAQAHHLAFSLWFTGPGPGARGPGQSVQPIGLWGLRGFAIRIQAPTRVRVDHVKEPMGPTKNPANPALVTAESAEKSMRAAARRS